MGKAKKLAIGAAVAGAAGYVAGLLTAPKSGRETREDIKQAAGQGITEAEKQLKNLHTDLGKAVDEAKNRGEELGGKAQKELKDLADKAKDTKEKVREVLSAIHEGDANDKDLKSAVADAKHALDHLKDYLKK
ncbi:MAG TPA: YtxH domain-containing protein [Candidatus Saccharimonadales bacterium]|nr:YtxH domain-containing protein [Candidatus Saccharimonadales bacterium]